MQKLKKNVLNDLPEEALKFFKGDTLQARVFIDKYALKDTKGNLLEKNPKQMWKRVAREISSVEQKSSLKKKWFENFYFLLEDFKFIPGGRILFGAGNKRKVTLLNCYVIPIKEDSIEGIFDFTKEEARTYSYGGGVGTDISVLRPKGSVVHNSALYSTGAVSFMELFSLVTGIIGQSGRRGALMLTISIDHPDVVHFIDIKSKPNDRTKEIVGYMRSLFKDYFTESQYKKIEEFLGTQQVRFANISVRVTDEFMKAVIRDNKFILRFSSAQTGEIKKEVSARELWKKLIYGAWSRAEPGIMFWDTIKRESTSEYNGMNVVSTNPCSEIPLEPYGCCCLGNLNLSKIVKDPFSQNPKIDYDLLDRLVEYGVRFLDNVLTYSYSKHPLKAQAEQSIKSRRIGLGFTGLGSMLAMLKIKYDTKEAINLVNKLFERIRDKAYRTSIELAKEKGTFPLFDKEKHLKNSSFVKRLPQEIKNDIKKIGLRNVALLTVPPVGSGSALAGCSSGIEPIYDLRYLRRSESLSQKEFWVEEHTLRLYREISKTKQGDKIPEYFVTAHQISPFFRVKMQATIQKYIDHAISSTVNLPKDIDIETVDKIYFEAWKQGCKSITVYREGSREGILVTEKEAVDQKKEKIKIKEISFTASAMRYRLKTEVGTSFITLTRNTKDNDLVEVFIEIGRSGSSVKALAESLGRQLSLSLRGGLSPLEIVDQLLRIKGSRTVPNYVEVVHQSEVYKGLFPVYSLPDAVAKAILVDMFLHNELSLSDLQEIGGVKLEKFKEKSQNKPKKSVRTLKISKKNQEKLIGDLCPECGGILIFSNGCFICSMCGYSTCE